MTAERRESMLTAVESSDGFGNLRTLVKRYLDEGIRAEQLLDDLSKIRALVSDDVEELVLDVMDLLVGWCAPEFKLVDKQKMNEACLPIRCCIGRERFVNLASGSRVIQHRVEARYRREYGKALVILATSKDVEALTDTVLTVPPYHNFAQLHSLDPPLLPSRYPHHEDVRSADGIPQVEEQGGNQYMRVRLEINGTGPRLSRSPRLTWSVKYRRNEHLHQCRRESRARAEVRLPLLRDVDPERKGDA